MYDTYVKSGCVNKVRGRYQCKFQDVTAPNRNKKFWEELISYVPFTTYYLI
jgi:hypothetical protein